MSENYRNIQAELRRSGKLYEDPYFSKTSTMNGYTPGSSSDQYSIRRDDLRQMGKLFEDPEFPVGNAILPRDLGEFRHSQVEWLRPRDIVDPGDYPQFITAGVSHHDVDQGLLSDCWFLSAAACLAISSRDLFERIVPPDQDFNAGYTGMFRFNFWRDGGFHEVIIDDRLPCINGKRVFAHNKEERNEFWPSLLEKAYAKFYGGYHRLHGGDPNDALLDLTGGLTEFTSLDKYQDDMKIDKDFDGKADVPLFLMLVRMRRMSSLLCCFTKLEPSQRRETVLSNGLIAGHGYTLTGLAIVEDSLLLKMRNPWGDKYEWKGPWGDDSTEWNRLTREEKELLGYKNRDDGEFWIPYQEFLRNFAGISMCHLSPKGMSDLKGKHGWNELRFAAEWLRGLNAGGSMKEPTFWQNPQFAVTLDKRDDVTGDGLISTLVSLLQTNAKDIGDQRSGICYDIFKVRRGARPDQEGKFHENDLEYIEGHPTYVVRPTSNYCECIGRHNLPPESYVFIPSTMRTGEEGSFLFRVYTESPARGGYD